MSLAVAVSPADADNPAYALTSSSPTIASVSGRKVTAKKAGTARIIAAASDGSGVTAEVRVTIRLKAVSKIKAVQRSSGQQVAVTFNKISGAKGYDVYRASKKNGAYKKIGSTKTTAFVDQKAQKGKTYFYKITARAAKSESNSLCSSKYASVKVLASPAAKCKAAKSRKVAITWKKVSNASGYVVYTSAQKTKGFKAAKTLTKGSAVKASITAKKNRKTIYIKVRAFYKQNGKKVYGPFSKTVAVKVKK